MTLADMVEALPENVRDYARDELSRVLGPVPNTITREQATGRVEKLWRLKSALWTTAETVHPGEFPLTSVSVYATRKGVPFQYHAVSNCAEAVALALMLRAALEGEPKP